MTKTTKPSTKPDVKSAFLTTEGESSPEHADLVLNELFDLGLVAENFISGLDRLIEEAITNLAELKENPEDEELKALLANEDVKKFIEEIEEHKDFRLADDPDIKELLAFVKNLGHLSAVNERLTPIDQIGLRALKRRGQDLKEKKEKKEEKITRER